MRQHNTTRTFNRWTRISGTRHPLSAASGQGPTVLVAAPTPKIARRDPGADNGPRTIATQDAAAGDVVLKQTGGVAPSRSSARGLRLGIDDGDGVTEFGVNRVPLADGTMSTAPLEQPTKTPGEVNVSLRVHGNRIIRNDLEPLRRHVQEHTERERDGKRTKGHTKQGRDRIWAKHSGHLERNWIERYDDHEEANRGGTTLADSPNQAGKRRNSRRERNGPRRSDAPGDGTSWRTLMAAARA